MQMLIKVVDGVKNFHLVAMTPVGHRDVFSMQVFPDNSYHASEYVDSIEVVLDKRKACQTLEDVMRGFWGFPRRVDH